MNAWKHACIPGNNYECSVCKCLEIPIHATLFMEILKDILGKLGKSMNANECL